jgi:hypothetical protein
MRRVWARPVVAHVRLPDCHASSPSPGALHRHSEGGLTSRAAFPVHSLRFRNRLTGAVRRRRSPPPSRRRRPSQRTDRRGARAGSRKPNANSSGCTPLRPVAARWQKVSPQPRPMKCPVRGRQPGHPPLPLWRRERSSLQFLDGCRYGRDEEVSAISPSPSHTCRSSCGASGSLHGTTRLHGGAVTTTRCALRQRFPTIRREAANGVALGTAELTLRVLCARA